jgi:hypothetical protein
MSWNKSSDEKIKVNSTSRPHYITDGQVLSTSRSQKKSSNPRMRGIVPKSNTSTALIDFVVLIFSPLKLHIQIN